MSCYCKYFRFNMKDNNYTEILDILKLKTRNKNTAELEEVLNKPTIHVDPANNWLKQNKH